MEISVAFCFEFSGLSAVIGFSENNSTSLCASAFDFEFSGMLLLFD